MPTEQDLMAQKIVDEHLDEMMSPHEYNATRRVLISAIAAALTKQREETWADDDVDFIKLVRQLAALNGSVDGLAEAIIEDVGYGAHRVDRLYAAETARKEGNTKHAK